MRSEVSGGRVWALMLSKGKQKLYLGMFHGLHFPVFLVGAGWNSLQCSPDKAVCLGTAGQTFSICWSFALGTAEVCEVPCVSVGNYVSRIIQAEVQVKMLRKLQDKLGDRVLSIFIDI